MVRIRPGHVEQHVRHQRALPAGVELLEEPRKLADDALLAVALGCNSIDIWNLRLELGRKLGQGLRTRLGTRFPLVG